MKMRFAFLLLLSLVSVSKARLKLFSWDGEAIERAREVEKGKLISPHSLSSSLLHLWKESKRDLENLAEKGYPSVYEKEETVEGAEGDKSYYSSVVPYAFPCNELPENCVDYEGKPFTGNCSSQGIPWAICDGKVNRKAALLTDRVRLEEMMHIVMRLSLSGYVFDDLERSEQAAKVLRTWFLDKYTGMRPTLRFGQGVPGKYTGKPSACMDMYFSGRGFIDAIQLLEQTPGADKFWSWKDETAMEDWASNFARYLHSNSEVERESSMKNNHGVYYDVTLLSWATLGNEREIIQRVNGSANCADYKFCIKGRIENQIDDEGMLKYELDRADPGHYLWYTLLANAYLANIADRLGSRAGFDSASLRRAMDWALPHLLSNSSARIEGRNEYAVHAYRMFARGTGNPVYEEAVCSALRAQIEDHAHRFWATPKVGIHVLNIVMPSKHTEIDEACDAWKSVARLHKDKEFWNYWKNLQEQKQLVEKQISRRKWTLEKNCILIVLLVVLVSFRKKLIHLSIGRNKST